MLVRTMEYLGLKRDEALELFNLLGGFVYSQTLLAFVKFKFVEILSNGPLERNKLKQKCGLKENEFNERLNDQQREYRTQEKILNKKQEDYEKNIHDLQLKENKLTAREQEVSSNETLNEETRQKNLKDITKQRNDLSKIRETLEKKRKSLEERFRRLKLKKTMLRIKKKKFLKHMSQLDNKALFDIMLEEDLARNTNTRTILNSTQKTISQKKRKKQEVFFISVSLINPLIH